ncbi:MAG: class I SAM-dependent methyltransferase [Candidatus Competibacteraceae bacterium]|nr:class I SAM-dependent methyltransferase [Candidatus Competibacteraceae bacterium]
MNKNQNVETPPAVAAYLHRLLRRKVKSLIFDPCIGPGALVEPWRSDVDIMGMDIRDVLKFPVARFYQGRFEHCTAWEFPKPDLVVCNPPFNGGGRMMYAEQFLRQVVRIFGREQPMAMITPHGFRLN